MLWYEPDGRRVIVGLKGLQQARAHPERLEIDPWKSARRALGWGDDDG
jgi:hypothetical protein